MQKIPFGILCRAKYLVSLECVSVSSKLFSLKVQLESSLIDAVLLQEET